MNDAAAVLMDATDIVDVAQPPKKLLMNSEFDLLNLNKAATIQQARELLHNSAHKNIPLTPKTALNVLTSTDGLLVKTGLEGVDKALLGGLRPGTISELAGPAGSGKTQLCCQLAAVSVLSPNAADHGVLYVDTENAASASRILEICRERFPTSYTEELIANRCSQVYLYRVLSTHSLTQLLSHTIQEIIIEKNIKLVIIDSIASLIRREFESRSASRSATLLQQAFALKEIAEGFNIAVVVVNQVQGAPASAASLSDSAARRGLGENAMMNRSMSDGVVVALGNTWCHAVNTRLTLQYISNSLRQLTITKSSIAPICHFTYKVTEKGLEEVTSSKPGFIEDAQTGNPSMQYLRSRNGFL